MTSGKFPCTNVPLATSVNTELTVSSVRVELMCSFLVACIAVVARRKRFLILSPASYTSCDRMIASIPGDGAFRAEARLAFVRPQVVNSRPRMLEMGTKDGYEGRRGAPTIVEIWIVDRLFAQHTLLASLHLIRLFRTKANYDRGFEADL